MGREGLFSALTVVSEGLTPVECVHRVSSFVDNTKMFSWFLRLFATW